MKISAEFSVTKWLDSCTVQAEVVDEARFVYAHYDEVRLLPNRT